jgi:hypothetical protein
VAASQSCQEFAGTCAGPVGSGGVWHTGVINNPGGGFCFGPAITNNCQSHGAITSGVEWFELLLTQAVEKVNQQVDADGDPVATAEIVNWAWNQSVDLGDDKARVTWELDNDVDDAEPVDLVADVDVLGSFSGPMGAVSGGDSPTGVGYPLFAAMDYCDLDVAPDDGLPDGTGSLAPCAGPASCVVPEECFPSATSVNGSAGANRAGKNACFFEGVGMIDSANHASISIARPPDDDLDNDGDALVDEFVMGNGPIRNMDITKAGGPDLSDVMLEDLIGDGGNWMQGAIGFHVLAGGVRSFGLAIDDMVLEWREYELVADSNSCGPFASPGKPLLTSTQRTPGGAVSFTYVPACQSGDNTIVWGELSDLHDLGLPVAYQPTDPPGPQNYCSIGNTGSYAAFDPPTPLNDGIFFLVVANDGAVTEGSYGGRPPSPFNSSQCNLAQNLTNECD